MTQGWTKQQVLDVARSQIGSGNYLVYLEGGGDDAAPLVSASDLSGAFFSAVANLKDGGRAAVVGYMPDNKDNAERLAERLSRMPQFRVVEGPSLL